MLFVFLVVNPISADSAAPRESIFFVASMRAGAALIAPVPGVAVAHVGVVGLARRPVGVVSIPAVAGARCVCVHGMLAFLEAFALAAEERMPGDDGVDAAVVTAIAAVTVVPILVACRLQRGGAEIARLLKDRRIPPPKAVLQRAK